MSKLTVPAGLLAVLLAGCSMAPAYHRPAAPVPGQYPSGPAYGGTLNQQAGPAAADIGWQEFFGDPRLRRIIGLALANNRDLRVAVLNVEKARAQYRIQRADLFPTIEASASGARQRLSVDQRLPGAPAVTGQYSAGLGFTAYELDFFGRVKNLKDAALQQYFATAEARRSAQISLVAEVANAYLTERALDEQLAVVRQTLKSQLASYNLTKRSFELGNTNGLDLRTAQTQVETARANLAALMQQRAQAANALALLVGGPLPADLPAPRPLEEQGIMANLPAGLPSGLLLRRPDILQAEHQLVSANANIGAARAAFFPSISLTGSVGTASSQLSGLFGGGTGIWSFLPQINLPIFDAGRNRANLDVATVEKDINVAQYEKAIQSAFREVSDSLTARAMLNDQIAAQERLAKAEQQRAFLANARYRTGIDSYLNLLDAQRELYVAQQSLIQSRLSRLTNLVNLYKALGGGWLEHGAGK